MKITNPFVKLFSILILSVCIFSCNTNKNLNLTNSNEIIILYENDVHCAVDGYTKLSGLKRELEKTYTDVGVVSVGDFIQGDSLGAISQGEYIVNIMNLVGYDAITLGNHEFDYKIPRLMELCDLMQTKPVSTNFKYLKKEKSVFEPYKIIRYGNVDVAFIGITTPSTISSSSPSQFLDTEGNYIYSFSGDDLFSVVQNAIDSAKKNGAEYVIALSHLGTENVNENWSAQSLVKNTTDIDVVLDGHSHSVIENLIVQDKNGESVSITSTGTKFANIGKLTISKNGKISTELISTKNINYEDKIISDYITKIKNEYNKLGTRKIGINLVDLITHDKNGNRLIRNSETNLGDFCADAFRIITNADVGFINGGGIRSNLPQGEVTFNSILSVFPFNNTVCVAEISGKNILDFLELSVMSYPNENGSFQHISGITFDVTTSIPSSVMLDKNEVFVSVNGPYRVSNVKILNSSTGSYETLQLEKMYKVASHNYLLINKGSGASMFDNAKIILNDGMLDVEMLEKFITENLSGIINEEYSSSQNRIRFF